MCTVHTISNEMGDGAVKMCWYRMRINGIFSIFYGEKLILLSISYKMQNKVTSSHPLYLSLPHHLPKIAKDTLWNLFTFWLWILNVYLCLCIYNRKSVHVTTRNDAHFPCALRVLFQFQLNYLMIVVGFPCDPLNRFNFLNKSIKR